MFDDARTLSDQSVIETDLAIIGTGPAGITLARALAGRKFNICLIESGGLQFDPDVQALYEGETTGIDYPLDKSRLRYFGGSSNHWGGFCRPLDGIDFEARDWVPYSGWPFGRDELSSYYEMAATVVEVAPGQYDDGDYWREKTAEQPLQPASGRLRIQIIHYSPPTRFGERYSDDLKRGGNISVLLNANVTNIAVTESGRAVSHLVVRTLSGRTHRVKARQYVLATGGLENARLLLLSRDFNPKGLGNQNDLVGRFFMEHPTFSNFCEGIVADLPRLPRLYREQLYFDGREVKAAFNPSYSFLRKRRLLNASFQCGVAGTYRDEQDASSIYGPERTASHTAMLRAAQRFLRNRPDLTSLGVWLGFGCACEQVPNPDSRVTLSNERDALGLEKIRLDWRLTEQDRRSVVEHIRSLALEFGTLGIGRIILNIEDDGRWPAYVSGGNHHMGTTRMNDDAQKGVVDRHCRVHGIDNLYVAGSSVFPTCGTANPTLTIVALALRLADHLKGKLS